METMNFGELAMVDGGKIFNSQNLTCQIASWLPPVRLVALRRCNLCCGRSVAVLLENNKALRDEFEEALSSLLDKRDKRVWVGIRVRPHQSEQTSLQVDRRRIVQTIAGNEASFFFDRIFNENARQEEVWTSLQGPMMRALLRREHCCLFAYGQTGSGKTHTVFGDPTTTSSKGVAFRLTESLSKILNGFQPSISEEVEERVVVEFSFLEVYNEKIHDLLSNSKLCFLAGERDEIAPGSTYKAPTFAAEERVVVRGLTRRRCDLDKLTEQVNAWLHEGASSRMVGKTMFNPRSSRSHAVATIHICWNDRPGKKGNETRLYIVDLAGSERSGQYATSSEQLREGAHINLSLSTLGRVVSSLSRGHGDHIPHRDSALTWLLTDAITGHQARAFMIATVNPEHCAETHSTLRYAQAYSSLQSDFSTLIPRLRSTLRTLQRRVEVAKNELDTVCVEINTNSRFGKTTEWNRETLKSRVVRIVRHGEQHFQGHPFLKWTETHATKAVLGQVGVIEETCPVPPERIDDDLEDGRRRHFRVTGATSGRCARVVFAGRHGHPSIHLWFPEDALEDVTPHPRLRELLTNLMGAERALQQKQAQLDHAQRAFSAELEQFMEG